MGATTDAGIEPGGGAVLALERQRPVPRANLTLIRVPDAHARLLLGELAARIQVAAFESRQPPEPIQVVNPDLALSQGEQILLA